MHASFKNAAQNKLKLRVCVPHCRPFSAPHAHPASSKWSVLDQNFYYCIEITSLVMKMPSQTPKRTTPPPEIHF